jgi:chromosomal replication initiator protein
MILVADIQRAIAGEYGLTVGQLREPAPRHARRINTWDKSHPRQAAMALALLLTEHSMTRIGQFFGGRDRTTVLHAARVVAERRKSDPKLHDAMRRVTFDLVRHG